LDLNAIQTSKLLKLNRKTINEYYMTFRCAIALNQHDEFEKFVGMVELDESYFRTRRIRGFREKWKRNETELQKNLENS